MNITRNKVIPVFNLSLFTISFVLNKPTTYTDYVASILDNVKNAYA